MSNANHTMNTELSLDAVKSLVDIIARSSHLGSEMGSRLCEADGYDWHAAALVMTTLRRTQNEEGVLRLLIRLTRDLGLAEIDYAEEMLVEAEKALAFGFSKSVGYQLVGMYSTCTECAGEEAAAVLRAVHMAVDGFGGIGKPLPHADEDDRSVPHQAICDAAVTLIRGVHADAKFRAQNGSDPNLQCIWAGNPKEGACDAPTLVERLRDELLKLEAPRDPVRLSPQLFGGKYVTECMAAE